MKAVTVENPGNLPTIPFHDLKAFYEANKLKAKKGRNIGDLKTSILTLGFKFPISIWVEGKYIIDGAGRIEALTMLEYEGYDIPAIPYTIISARTKKEAKEAVLAISSQYGKASQESVAEFVLDDTGDIELSDTDFSFFDLPGLTLEEVEFRPQREKKERKPRGESASKIVHTCPECGHEFQ